MDNRTFMRRLGRGLWDLIWMTGLALLAYRLVVGGGPLDFPGLL